MSTEKQSDGGAAFPRITEEYSPVDNDWHTNEGNDGMSLRDYFAGQALAAMLVSPLTAEDCARDERKAAVWAYSQADAMLVQRSKEQNARVEFQEGSAAE